MGAHPSLKAQDRVDLMDSGPVLSLPGSPAPWLLGQAFASQAWFLTSPAGPHPGQGTQ